MKKGTINPKLAAIQDRLSEAGSYQGLRERAELEPKRLSESEIPPSHRIWEVWNQIKSAYPGPTANWEDEPPQIWAYAIEGMTDNQVKQGIANLVSRDSDFPPSAGQFRDLCMMDLEWEIKRISRPVSEVLAIDKESHKTDVAQEAGRAFFEQMRQQGLVL